MADARVGCGEDYDGEEDEAVRLRARLALRLSHALDLAGDEHARSLALREIAAGLRERRLRVRTCAWCESICLGGDWHRVSASHLVSELSRYGTATHGICPSCFEVFLPDVEYPHEDKLHPPRWPPLVNGRAS